MIRALLLAALALACVCSPAMAAECSPAPVTAKDWLWLAGFIALAFTYVAFDVWRTKRRADRESRYWAEFLRRPCWLAGITCGAAAILLIGGYPALAAEEVVAVSPTVVSAEWGPYLEVVLRWLSDAAVPLLTALIGGYLFRTYPMLRMILSETIIENTLSKWADYGINATAGAAKGKTLNVNVGSEALANMLRRGQERASASNVSAWVMKAGGGPEEVAKKLFRKLPLDADASGAMVLPKALEKAGVVPASSGPSARELRDMDEMTRR